MSTPWIALITESCSSIIKQDNQSHLSGTVLHFKTDDPVGRPLRDWDLLDMQWVLQQVTALSGGVEDNEDFLNDNGEPGSDTFSWMNIGTPGEIVQL